MVILSTASIFEEISDAMASRWNLLSRSCNIGYILKAARSSIAANRINPIRVIKKSAHALSFLMNDANRPDLFDLDIGTVFIFYKFHRQVILPGAKHEWPVRAVCTKTCD